MENGLPIVWIFQTRPKYDGKNIIDNRGHIVQLRANPVYGVATICHQVRCLRWGHPSLFHTATSLLIWYEMFCMRDISYRLIWMKFINMLSEYAQSGTHRHFNWWEREREIKFIGLFEDRGHQGPYSPYKPFNHNLYILIGELLRF